MSPVTRRCLAALILVLVIALVPTAAFAATQVAYVRGGKLVLQAADGSSTPRNITTHSLVHTIDYSPGGQRIALSEGRYDGAWTDTLQYYDIDEARLRTIFDGTAFVNAPHFETWSPNGRYLIWTRMGTDMAFKYDTSTHSSAPFTAGDKFKWSPDGSKLVFARGRDLYLASPGGASILLAHIEGYVPTTDFEIRWYRDGTSSSAMFGYFQEGDDWHVYDVNLNTGAVTVYLWPPVDWKYEAYSRDGEWILDTGMHPSTLSDDVTTYVVGPNVPTIVHGSVSSNGGWTALTNWWGGAGEWNIWTCERGHTPKKLVSGGFMAELRPSPLCALDTPYAPSKVHQYTNLTVGGLYKKASELYPPSGDVRVIAQKYYGGKWHSYYDRPAMVDGYSRILAYQATFKFGPGKWRLRAKRVGDISCATTNSGWRTITVYK